jgi:hypothetical protein
MQGFSGQIDIKKTINWKTSLCEKKKPQINKRDL